MYLTEVVHAAELISVHICNLPEDFNDRMRDILGNVSDAVPPNQSINSNHIEQLRYIRRYIINQEEKDIINSWIGLLTDFVQAEVLSGQRSSSVNSCIQLSNNYDILGTSVPPNLTRTSSSASTKSSTEASTGAIKGRGLGTQYSWNPPAAKNSNSSECSSTSNVFIQQ